MSHKITAVQFRAILAALSHRVQDAADKAGMHTNRLSRFLNGMTPTKETTSLLLDYSESRGFKRVGNWLYIPNMVVPDHKPKSHNLSEKTVKKMFANATKKLGNCDRPTKDKQYNVSDNRVHDDKVNSPKSSR